MDDLMLLKLAEKLRSVCVADDDYQLEEFPQLRSAGLLGTKQRLESQFDKPIERVMVQLECDRRDGLSQRLKTEYEELLEAAADLDKSCSEERKTDLQKQLHLIALNMVPAIAEDIATLLEDIAREMHNKQTEAERLALAGSKRTHNDKGKAVEESKATGWAQVTVEIVDDNTVRYKVGNAKWQRATCEALGFFDKRKHLPNTLWSLFLQMAKSCNQRCIELRTERNVSKDMDRICDALKKFFGPQERPIRYNRKAKVYRVEFDLFDPRDF